MSADETPDEPVEPPRFRHIDDILREWPFAPDGLSVRKSVGGDGRDILQMRLDLGLLQLETTGRPDGTRPHGHATYLDWLLARENESPDSDFVLTPEECAEADREFVQYYHRRICWLATREFGSAARDADHTLALMDVCKRRSPDERWTLTHEQYRPFVLFHRTQAAALDVLESAGPEASVETINEGLATIRALLEENEAAEGFEDDEMVQRLRELQASLRTQFDVGRTLKERLSDAIASEQYELAAKLRDELAQRGTSPGN